MKKAKLVQLAARRGIKEVKQDMLKDKIICLILGQDPKAIKKEEADLEDQDQPPSTSRVVSRHSSCPPCRVSKGTRLARPVEPTTSDDSENEKEEKANGSISSEGFAAEDVGVEENQTWELIAPSGKSRRRKRD